MSDDGARLVGMLRTMYRIRFFEERVKELFGQNLIWGGVHLYIGQEAVATGACAALRRDDYLVSTHRGHGHCLAKGGDIRRTMAELMGRDTGYCRGRGGSMHLFDPEIGLLGGNGIVGAGLPIALGAALSAQYRGSDQVCACFFSDGASNQGTFHESLNLAALWKLPLVYICENNLYAATTPASKTLPLPDIYVRAAAYGIPGVSVDGNDVEAVYQAVSQAVTRARGGEGPSLVECKTYRIEGHCMVLDCHRDPEELAAWKERDPIRMFEGRLLEMGVIATDDIAELRSQAEADVREAVEYAQASPFPSADDLGLADLPAAVVAGF
ncbi:MAG: thiamine pyrophosphate-dependent dehydrogenase E1 component subunit alpha [Anaerolineae bacterium]|nr:thiamine pyrophosphate-dependent dehydrogenase E1 component subunit alpha [Anaerolineae bacterium]